jgi:uncharacterized membrane protein YhaH (DUF805 family)
MVDDLDTRTVGAPSTGTNRTTIAYAAGALATAAGLAYAAVDHLALGGLERHLHALYDPVGKYGESTPLYGYLYLVGILGLLCWWANLRLSVRRAPAAQRWGWITLAAATLPVTAPLVMQEYGQPVIPLSLAVGYLVAWVFGLVGLLVR